MALEMTLLRVLRERDEFDKLYRGIRLEVLDGATQTILKNYKRYFESHPVEQRIDFDPFWTWWKQVVMPNQTPEFLKNFGSVLAQIEQPVSEDVRNVLLDQLVGANAAYDMAALLTRWQDGEEIDLQSAMSGIVEQFENDIRRKVKTPWVDDDIEGLLDAQKNDMGFLWRLQFLNDSMRPLMGGDFGIVAARPDVGKTTWFTDNLTYMASQLKRLFPLIDPPEGWPEGKSQRPIIWFNNEGPGNKIVLRMYQSALCAGFNDLVELKEKGVLKERYSEEIGHAHNIRIFDIHDFWSHEVEDIIRQLNPSLVLFDMIDNIKFGGNIANSGQRTDQVLEAMYQWARVLAVKYNMVSLATSQISADGENLQYPLLGMLKDSKTGKQGAADFIITIGFQAQFEDARFIGTTKNKLAKEGGKKNPKKEVKFDGAKGRFLEVEYALPEGPAEDASDSEQQTS